MSALAVVATAVPIGAAFGALLERAGLGDPRVIAGQFTGRNFAVVRVMFGAIVTAMLGVVWLGAAGYIDPGAIAIPPTDIAGQTIGAAIFGGGFALASLCPGTACVAASSGRREGVAAVVGLLVGTLLTALLWPLVEGAIGANVREGARLGDDVHVSIGAIVVAITVLSVTGMSIARRFDAASTTPWWKLSTPEVVSFTLAATFAFTRPAPTMLPAGLTAIASEIAREQDHLDPLELAEMIKSGARDLRIIDVRDGVDSMTYTIPGAEHVSLDSLPLIQVERSQQIVLYSDGGTHAAQGWVLLRARGVHNARVLKDGMAAWEDEVMRPAPPAAPAADSAAKRFERARALSLWFGGRPRLDDGGSAGTGPAAVAATRVRRRKTC